MNAPLMISAQESDDSLWRLGKGQSMPLDIGPGARRLRLRQGRLWLTAQGALDAPAEDIWLLPGDEALLPSGARVVAEGWPDAAFELIVPPRPVPGRPAQASFGAAGNAVSALARSMPARRATPWQAGDGSPRHR